MKITKFYSSNSPATTSQNRFINVMEEVSPRLGILNTHFAAHHYWEVVSIYEELSRKYSGFTTDMGKIAFAYFKTGRYPEALQFLAGMDELKQDHVLLLVEVHAALGDANSAEMACVKLLEAFGNSTGYMVLGDLYQKLGQPANAFHAYMNVLLKGGNEPMDNLLQLKILTALARTEADENPVEAEHYLYSALQYIPSSLQDIQQLEFAEIVELVQLNPVFQSIRIVTALDKLKPRSARSAEEEWVQASPAELAAAFTLRLFRRSAESMAEWKSELLAEGDLLIRNLNEHLEAEQPSYARAVPA